MNKKQKERILFISAALLLLLAAFLAGFLVSKKSAQPAGHRHMQTNNAAQPSRVGTAGKGKQMAGGMAKESPGKASTWTCSMHPQIQLPEPGKCPICHMDLIPLEEDTAEETGRRKLTISEHAKELMEIETSPATRRFVTARVRMVGKVDYDETRISHITAWVPGRIDRLFVDYTGIEVSKGQHMVRLYSPELLSAQEELLQAMESASRTDTSEVPVVRSTAEATVEAARKKLRLWGLKEDQIQQIIDRGKPRDTLTIYAPGGGIVIDKNAQQGMYVNTGTHIYTLADLSQVWVNLDAYESDLQWLRYGQSVEFTAEAYPGRRFEGKISFIHPVLDESTRTVKVRLNVPNTKGLLKPGMFVRASAMSELAAGGKVMDPSFAGQWVCPMHPGVVKNGSGNCDVCEMPLVQAANLGYEVAEPHAEKMPLVIPASAPLLTGKRAVVYVEVPDTGKPTYEGREVHLGPRAGSHYIVRAGLSEGERVVTQGAFKLDAELQIRAKPSMMTPEDPDHSPVHKQHTEHAGHENKMEHEKQEAGAQTRPQANCPIMGGPINKEVYVDYKGQRIYFCCPGCEKTFLKTPEKFLKEMRSKGIRIEQLGEKNGS